MNPIIAVEKRFLKGLLGVHKRRKKGLLYVAFSSTFKKLIKLRIFLSVYSASQAEEFTVRHVSPRHDVNSLLHTADQDQQQENRRVLMSIVTCLLFLASQNIALRGHDDDRMPDKDNLHQGNFKNLIAFRAEAGDSILVKHLQTCPKNASYLSPRVQNELILLLASIVRGKLIRELIDDKLYYSLLADETADTSGTEQLPISVRYVSAEPDSNGELIHEVFLGFIPLDNLKAVGVAEKLCSFVTSIGLNINLIRGTSLSKKTACQIYPSASSLEMTRASDCSFC